MKFKKGDRITSSSGLNATVDAISFNSIYQEYEVYVTWDHYPGSYGYILTDIQDDWAVEPSVNSDADVMDSGLVLTGNKCEYKCEHKWVEVGFMHTKIVCYYCDIEKA